MRVGRRGQWRRERDVAPEVLEFRIRELGVVLLLVEHTSRQLQLDHLIQASTYEGEKVRRREVER